MKKFLIYSILFQLVFFACKKSEIDPIFEESSNKRVTTQIEAYKKQLISSEYGWKGLYYPNGAKDGGYSFFLKFDANGNVSMYSDIDGFYYFTNGYDKAFTTTYQIKALQKPTLVFDSYSYLHELVNPDYNGGTGQLADLELAISSSTDAQINLVGNVHQTEMVLTKITKTESESLAKGGLASVFNNTYDYANTGKFLTLVFPTGEKSDLLINMSAKQLGLFYINKSGEVDVAYSAFSVTTTGIQLKDAISLYGIKFQELFWDDAKKLYYINVNNTRINITGTSKPALPFYYALGNLFVGFNMNPNIPTQTVEYKALYEKIKANVISLSTAAPVRVIGNVFLEYLPDDGVFALVVSYTRTNPDGTLVFNGAGVLYYQPSLDSKGNIKFTRLSTTATLSGGTLSSGISGIVSAGIKPLTDVLEGNTFLWDYDPTAERTAVLKSNGPQNISIKGLLY
ncbi:uncharacterized protein DUF4302 [Arcicella aurantiaca]|uniref:Uncharacterized protein DUF4302 n=1 Tax=Arcicella aurantiaca TaxID=591202 RepID=A0A316EEU7_9BACT|nr:DUF4302 domain-containing protein [Arcicella aurantiaca]PWK27843.1 uncharacterized protein DUF4302 [Arcicella aurantiaca]